MKAMSKQELADCAGVSVRTLYNWLKPFQNELAEMGASPRMKVFPPKVVEWITTYFSIETG